MENSAIKSNDDFVCISESDAEPTPQLGEGVDLDELTQNIAEATVEYEEKPVIEASSLINSYFKVQRGSGIHGETEQRESGNLGQKEHMEEMQISSDTVAGTEEEAQKESDALMTSINYPEASNIGNESDIDDDDDGSADESDNEIDNEDESEGESDSEDESETDNDVETTKSNLGDDIDPSWELVDLESVTEEERANLLNSMSIISENDTQFVNLEYNKKSKVRRKFIANSKLFEKLQDLQFSEFAKETDELTDFSKNTNSLFTQNTLDCSLNNCKDENDESQTLPNNLNLAKTNTIWMGSYLGANVEVSVEPLNGINVVNLQVEHKDILSSLLSFQRFVACTGITSYCDVDVTSLLSKASTPATS